MQTLRAIACLGLALAAPAMAADRVLTLSAPMGLSLALDLKRDEHGIAADPSWAVQELPAFRFSYRQQGQALTPLPGYRDTGHPHWQYLPGAGTLDDGRFTLPLALRERNADCIHYGLLRGELAPGEATAAARFEVHSENCAYLQFDADATVQLGAAWSSADVGEPPVAKRLPVAPLSTLAERFPDIDTTDFLPRTVDTLTVAGLLLDGVHYQSHCPTRAGDHPFCEQLPLPSYSLAKSLFAAVALMRLEYIYPRSSQRKVGELVPACTDPARWDDVTLADLLDMRSGNYGSTEHGADEGSEATVQGFFLPTTHAARIDYSCKAWPRRAAPGSRWVYHSSDTYILGTAMTALLRDARGADADLFDDLLQPLWQPLALSPLARETRRTEDEARQPFAGYGLLLEADDALRLGASLAGGALAAQLDPAMLAAALAPDRAAGELPGQFYRLGFWGVAAEEMLGCREPLTIPYMSGFGGINLVLLPNGIVYYVFSDGNDHDFSAAIRAADRLRPLCDKR